MSERPHKLRRALPVALTAVAVLSFVYVFLPSRTPSEAAVIEATFSNFISVDSEHGELNGVLRPEIVYDVYVDMPDRREFVLWATPDTGFYRQRGGGLDKVSVTDFGSGTKVRAHIGEINYSGYRPSAYVLKLVAHE